MDEDRDSFLAAARVAGDLVRRPDVSERWAQESACAGGSVGADTPEFPDEAVGRVLGLLTWIAVRRHGQAAVVRALSRPQRAPSSVSAF